jgi:hypothetical protein
MEPYDKREVLRARLKNLRHAINPLTKDCDALGCWIILAQKAVDNNPIRSFL